MHKRNLAILLFVFGVLFFVSVALASTSLTYEYDANGNLTSGDGKYYEYDDANKLVKVRHSDAAGPVIAEYFYDYTGQRIKKIENGVTTYYIGKHYEEQKTDTSQTHAGYYFANGERVAKKDDSGNLSYFHSDHLGGTNALTDSTGSLIQKTTYYPFGEIRQGGSEKYAYTGKEKDKLTDFYYFEARYYDSGFEHFAQVDTAELDLYDPQALNRYAYVRNNPIKLIDPSGNSWQDVFKIVSWANKIADVYKFIACTRDLFVITNEAKADKNKSNVVKTLSNNNSKINTNSNNYNNSNQLKSQSKNQEQMSNLKGSNIDSRINQLSAQKKTDYKMVQFVMSLTSLPKAGGPANWLMSIDKVLTGGQLKEQVDEGIISIIDTEDYKRNDPISSPNPTLNEVVHALSHGN